MQANLQADFELLTRIAREHDITTIPEALTRYRVRLESESHRIRSVSHNVLISTNALHWFLDGEFSFDECHSLAAIFHRMTGEIAPLSQSRALAMFDKVADRIAGPQEGWDEEVKSVYSLQRRMIFFHHILRRKPLAFLVRPIAALRLRN